MNALEAHAQGVLAAGKADVVMLGHSHHPVRKELPAPGGTGLYFNTGDWIWHQSYVEWDGTDFRLRDFGAETASDEEPDPEAQRPVEQREGKPDELGATALREGQDAPAGHSR